MEGYKMGTSLNCHVNVLRTFFFLRGGSRCLLKLSWFTICIKFSKAAVIMRLHELKKIEKLNSKLLAFHLKLFHTMI